MYYAGTVLLRMPEEKFWKCTPRKLAALMDMYNKLNGGGNSEDTKKQVRFIDEVMY